MRSGTRRLAVVVVAVACASDPASDGARVDGGFDGSPPDSDASMVGDGSASDGEPGDVRNVDARFFDAQPEAAPGSVGAPCTDDVECAVGVCLAEATRPELAGGYCTVRDCTRGLDDDCPAGSRCVGGTGSGSVICVTECTGDAGCRDGYSCCDRDDAGVGWCFVDPYCPR